MWRGFWEWLNRAASVVQLWPVITIAIAAAIAATSGLLAALSRMQWWAILITEIAVFSVLVVAAIVLRLASRRGRALPPASAVGELDMHPRRKRFSEQIRDWQRSIHDPYGHELRRLLELLHSEIAGNLRHQTSKPERGYLTAVVEHRRAYKAENDDPELTRALQELSAAYSAVESYRPSGRALFVQPPTYKREAEALLALIENRVNRVH